MKIGVRGEDKNAWERRVPLIPEDIAALRRSGITISVQSSGQRVYTDEEFKKAGIPVVGDLKEFKLIVGLKEIPEERLEPDKIYFIFSHVIKGQAYNMPMLKRMMTLGNTLVDYERIVDDQNRRLIFFGRHAGIAGMINSLWALGRRLTYEEVPNPLNRLRQAITYGNLSEAIEDLVVVAKDIRQNGLPGAVHPLIVGFLGYGNVSRGAQEVFDRLPYREVDPSDIGNLVREPHLASNMLYKVVFKEEHLVESRDRTQPFDLDDYYRSGTQKYTGIFDRYLDHFTMLINCNYWDHRYPRVLTRDACRKLWGRGRQPKLKVIGDISCDIEGSVECTVKPSYPDNPVYVYHPDTGETKDGFEGHGPVVMAVEILPSELPRESSAYFSGVLTPYLSAISTAGWKGDFHQLDLPPEIKRAVILYQGALTPDYRYLEEYLSVRP